MRNIFFTSDTHFCHSKPFLYEPRGFKNAEENCQEIVKRWNSIITDEDEVYLLGDIMLEDNERATEYFSQLKGNIHIILGNHDSQNRQELYETFSNVVDIKYADVIKIKKQHYYLSHYPTFCSNYDDKPYHNHLINLYGHTHQQTNFFNDNPFMYHVGLDSHNCYPISIDEIDKDIHTKINELYKEKMQKEKNLTL